MKKGTIVDIVSCLFILLFVYTGLFKLLDMNTFMVTIGKSRIIHPIAWPAAILVVLSELTIASLLIIPFFKDRPAFRKWGLIGGTGLMAMFTIYLFYMIYVEKEGPCTCGGIIQQMTWRQHLYFNTGFTLMGSIALWLNRQESRKASQDSTHNDYHPLNYNKI